MPLADVPEPFNFKKLLDFTSFFPRAGAVRKPHLPGLVVKIRSENGELNGSADVRFQVYIKLGFC